MGAAGPLLFALLAALPQEGHAPVLPGALEGRPSSSDASPIQARIDAAAPGARVEVGPGEYRGDLVIDRELTLVGLGRPRLVGSGTGSVIRVRAPRVTIEGFDIDGRGGGELSRDTSGIHVAAPGATIRMCRISNALFGVYLREAGGATIEDCVVRGVPGREVGEKGSGIHVWNTQRFRLARNTIIDVRDGIYIQSSPWGTVTGNVTRDMRYGLHYMSSDDNVFEDNLFERGAAGAVIMYSKRIVFRRNRLVRNRGFASVGLLFQTCDDVLAEDNLIGDNARGIFLEGTYRCVFTHNVIAGSDTAIVLFDNASGTRFTGNSFLGNLTPLLLVGRRTDTNFDGNYWTGNDEPDLDGDGRSDRPYRLSTVFDHFRGNLTAADLFADGFASAALGVAERAFPVLQPVLAEDRAPLARPPDLPRVPLPDDARTGPYPGGIVAGLLLFSGGILVLAAGRVRRTGASS